MYFPFSRVSIPGSRNPGSYNSSIFTLFSSGHILLPSHKQCMRVLTSPYPCQHLLLSVFFILAILAGVKWCLTVAQILFKENVHRKFLHCLPTTSSRNANHSMVVVSWMADRMERSIGNRMRKRRQPRDFGQSGSYLESTVFWISRHLKTQND